LAFIEKKYNFGSSNEILSIIFTLNYMIMKKVSILKFSLLLFPLIIAGCATFQSKIDGKFTAPAEKNYQAEKVNVLFIFTHLSQTKGFDAIPKLIENNNQRISGFDNLFYDALSEITNIGKYSTFTEYASDVNKTERREEKDSLIKINDYVIKMKFLREKSFAKHFFATIVSSVTATVFPMAYRYTYTVNVEVFNSKNQLIKTYQRQATLTKWVETFLLFVYPFFHETKIKEELYVTFMHDIFRQIETEKVLIKGQ